MRYCKFLKELGMSKCPQCGHEFANGSDSFELMAETPRRERETAKSLLELLNQKTGRNFRPVDAHMKMIIARLREHGEDTLRAMIAIKCREWRNDEKMSAYLRPGTLFRPGNCADYVGVVGTFAGSDNEH